VNLELASPGTSLEFEMLSSFVFVLRHFICVLERAVVHWVLEFGDGHCFDLFDMVGLDWMAWKGRERHQRRKMIVLIVLVSYLHTEENEHCILEYSHDLSVHQPFRTAFALDIGVQTLRFVTLIRLGYIQIPSSSCTYPENNEPTPLAAGTSLFGSHLLFSVLHWNSGTIQYQVPESTAPESATITRLTHSYGITHPSRCWLT